MPLSLAISLHNALFACRAKARSYFVALIPDMNVGVMILFSYTAKLLCECYSLPRHSCRGEKINIVLGFSQKSRNVLLN
jgi:hypothetical protein